MELARGEPDEAHVLTVENMLPGAVHPETATAMLRRCTALAARARIDLLTPSRCDATEELAELLGAMSTWDPAALEAPDPTMTVLAAAALQDLVARLDLADRRDDADRLRLAAGIRAVLAILQGLMEQARVTASA